MKTLLIMLFLMLCSCGCWDRYVENIPKNTYCKKSLRVGDTFDCPYASVTEETTKWTKYVIILNDMPLQTEKWKCRFVTVKDGKVVSIYNGACGKSI